MLRELIKLKREYEAWRAYQTLPWERRQIVFYSEGKIYWPFLRPFMQALIDTTDLSPTYVSSCHDDPGLTFCSDRVMSFVIGNGMIRTLWFMMLDAGVVFMTMPDIDVYHIKRSCMHPVHYVYANHGSDSVHMVLREQALDHYDTVFCSGPHNMAEIRKREDMYGLPRKNLVEVGYPYLDELIAEAEASQSVCNTDSPLRVLVAPSWSPTGQGTLELIGPELVDSLLNAGFEVIVRPHPQMLKLQPLAVSRLVDLFGDNSNFFLDSSVESKISLMWADVLVSDWSAIALEFAFSRLKPVLYIDMPRKAMNPNYAMLGIEPLEVTIRKKVGEILSPTNVKEAPDIIHRICSDPAAIADRCKALRAKWVYNVGSSAICGATALAELAYRKDVRKK